MAYKSYSFLGTSISQGYFDETGKGWVVRLFEKLNTDKPAHYYLSLLACSGDRSYDLWHRLCSESIQRQNDAVIIEVSCNDLVRQGSIEAQTDLSKGIRMELWGCLLELAKKNFSEVYVTSGLPKNEERMAATRTSDWNVWYKNEDIQEYNADVKVLCAQNNVPFIHLFPELDHAAYKETLEDAVHPNAQGHEMIAEAAYKKFKELGF